jgi:FMN-dependent NADH-azoreductase
VPILLHLDSSADLTGSVSRELTARFADAWRALGSSYGVVRRDLHTDPLPHLPTSELHWAPRLRRAEQDVPPEAEALQARLIQELMSADAVVIGAPMYNWSMPSTLKAWVDYVQVGGVTSTFDEPSQPLAGKPVVIVSSRGAAYGPGSGNEGTDHEIPALRQALGVALGMNLSVVIAELTLAPTVPAMAALREQAVANLTNAQSAIDALVSALGATSGRGPAT